MTEFTTGDRITDETLARWHAMISGGDLSGLPDMLHADVEFRSPALFKPYRGREALTLILTTAAGIFQDFTYHRLFATNDGKSVALEFSAHVGDKELKGADFIAFDDNGLITKFEVMVRPANGLMALMQEMTASIGDKLAAFRAG